jgi:hypothetical protein
VYAVYRQNTETLSQAFEECKASLSRSTMLAHPDVAAPIALVIDVSTTAMGAVLQQRNHNASQPLAFFSKKMSTAQQKYSAYDRELLAIYEAVKHFRHMLEARHFVIFTDHKPLAYAFNQKGDKCSPRQFNHLDYISQFTSDIRHISGQENAVDDALSRVEAVCTPVSPEALAEAQASDAELNALLQGTTALRLEKIQIPDSDVPLDCDTSTTRPRPYVHENIRRQVFVFLHGLLHLGARQRRNSFPNDSCSRRTAPTGYEHASLASGGRFPGIRTHQWGTSPCLHPGSSTCTSTSLVHFRHQTASDTALRQ